jgi:hypothetical protein
MAIQQGGVCGNKSASRLHNMLPLSLIAANNTKNNLDNKCLLITDTTSSHLINIEDYASISKVVFLLPKTTSILQPMDQGVTNFKAHYLQLITRYVISKSNCESKPTALWKKYNIRMAIDNAALA